MCFTLTFLGFTGFDRTDIALTQIRVHVIDGRWRMLGKKAAMISRAPTRSGT